MLPVQVVVMRACLSGMTNSNKHLGNGGTTRGCPWLVRCPRGPVGIAALLCRGQTAGGGSIPRWSASKPQVTRRKPDGAVQKKRGCPWLVSAHASVNNWCRGELGRAGVCFSCVSFLWLGDW